MTTIISADRLHWISDDGRDDPADLCAHSPVTCQIGDEVIARPGDGDWAVSAAAVFLLRALSRDHTKESGVGGQIFPCCGHAMYDTGGPEVLMPGCPSGIDFEIRNTKAGFQLSTEDGRVFHVAREDWRDAVVGFSDQVMRFYSASAPKEPAGDESRKGFDKMMSEWQRLHREHANSGGTNP